jgi:hypothetical protein
MPRMGGGLTGCLGSDIGFEDWGGIVTCEDGGWAEWEGIMELTRFPTESMLPEQGRRKVGRILWI